MSDIAAYEQLWNSFKAAKVNIDPHKATTPDINEELYVEIVDVEPHSENVIANQFELDIVVHLCSKCNFKTWDQVEYNVHVSYHKKLGHTIGDNSFSQNNKKTISSNKL